MNICHELFRKNAYFCLYLNKFNQQRVLKYTPWWSGVWMNPHPVCYQKAHSTPRLSIQISVTGLSSGPEGQGNWTHFAVTEIIYYWALGNPNTLAQGGTLSQAALGTAQLTTWPLPPTRSQDRAFQPVGRRAMDQEEGRILAGSCQAKETSSKELDIVFVFSIIRETSPRPRCL